MEGLCGRKTDISRPFDSLVSVEEYYYSLKFRYLTIYCSLYCMIIVTLVEYGPTHCTNLGNLGLHKPCI